VNPGIYGLGGQIVTPVQGPFAGVADARRLLQTQVLLCAGGGGGGLWRFGCRRYPLERSAGPDHAVGWIDVYSQHSRH